LWFEKVLKYFWDSDRIFVLVIFEGSEGVDDIVNEFVLF
jgi:hypothetical protein